MSLELTGAELRALRAQGQTLSDSLRIGREGASATVVRELDQQLQARQLVKVRFTDGDRHERAQLIETLAAATKSACAGSVGHTALFYRPAAQTE
jgi:RNA-binding protein